MAKKKTQNKTLEVSRPTRIPGEFSKSFIANFKGDQVTVSIIECDAKLIVSQHGLCAPVTGGVVAVDKITYICGNKRFVAKKGDVVVLVGKKATGLICGFTKKELDIIATYEAAKAYYTFVYEHTGATFTNLQVQELAIEYLANTCNNEGYWRTTVMAALKRHDNKILKYSGKYYKKVVKGENNANNNGMPDYDEPSNSSDDTVLEDKTA